MVCDYFGNAWIGTFIKTNNNVTLVPLDTLENTCVLLNENLKTDVVKASIAGTNLLGIYLAMNSNGIVLPNMVEPAEIELFKKLGLNTYISKEKMNAHGNNIAANDHVGIISGRVELYERKGIEDALGIELIETTIAEYNTVGSTCLLNNKGFLVHYATGENELRQLSSALKMNGEKGSINMGAGFVGRGAVANDKGYVAGELTSGFELGRIHSSLGFL